MLCMYGSLASVGPMNGSLEATRRDQRAMESALVTFHQHLANCNMQMGLRRNRCRRPYLEFKQLFSQIHFTDPYVR